MTDWREHVQRAQEAARRARAEAQRLREEAHRVEREFRDQARDAARQSRRSSANAFSSASSFNFQGSAEQVSQSEEVLSLDGVLRVRLDQPAGAVVVERCDAGEPARVTVSAERGGHTLAVTRAGDQLTIDVRQRRGGLLRRFHGATTTLRLPAGLTQIALHSGYGDVSIRGVACSRLDVDAGAGTIQADACEAELRANAGAGRIAVRNHQGSATCETGAGDVLIDVARVVAGEIRANAGMGRVEVLLPMGMVADVEASSGIGRARVDFSNAGEGAAVRVRAETGIGEATIRARTGAGEAPSPGPSRTTKPTHSARRGGTGSTPEELRVLELLEQRRITPEEAEDLIAALHGSSRRTPPGGEQGG